MSFACKSGAKECTACRECFSASVCESCGRKIPTGRLYYELFEKLICSDCIENIIAEEEMVCALCGDTVANNDEAFIFEDKTICSYCISFSERKKDYV